MGSQRQVTMDIIHLSHVLEIKVMNGQYRPRELQLQLDNSTTHKNVLLNM